MPEGITTLPHETIRHQATAVRVLLREINDNGATSHSDPVTGARETQWPSTHSDTLTAEAKLR